MKHAPRQQLHAKHSCNDLMMHTEACCAAKANKACVMKSNGQAVEKPQRSPRMVEELLGH